MENFYVVYFYNALDGDFGFDCGTGKLYTHLDRPTARSIVKHLRKEARRKGTDDFMDYWYENDWEE